MPLCGMGMTPAPAQSVRQCISIASDVLPGIGSEGNGPAERGVIVCPGRGANNATDSPVAPLQQCRKSSPVQITRSNHDGEALPGKKRPEGLPPPVVLLPAVLASSTRLGRQGSQCGRNIPESLRVFRIGHEGVAILP